jgi:hypothetical protein
MIETLVLKAESRYGRTAYMKMIDNKVIFDDSDGEYGPIEFDIEILADAFELHALKCIKAGIDLIK